MHSSIESLACPFVMPSSQVQPKKDSFSFCFSVAGSFRQSSLMPKQCADLILTSIKIQHRRRHALNCITASMQRPQIVGMFGVLSMSISQCQQRSCIFGRAQLARSIACSVVSGLVVSGIGTTADTFNNSRNGSISFLTLSNNGARGARVPHTIVIYASSDFPICYCLRRSSSFGSTTSRKAK